MPYAIVERNSGKVLQVATRKKALDSVVVVDLKHPEKVLSAAEVKKVYQQTTGKAARGGRKLVNEILNTVTQTGVENQTDKIGAVGQARAIFGRMKGKSRQDILAACVAAGINANTASTQLYKWNREHAH